ncbi:GTPase HflX [Desulfuribacillus alkaliarsenatis]|uniref:GTPase HflX n=1 Tax=Desulfuribacillus alkaliarsenatis TaxID=766136 RepID=A0A1E5FZP3_9FIRM|nr:GTPase HflX [Desulfuribacillus alkaliarsenatis]OEF96000.1 GTPase HflX [Desulfuribacillus alkaliarsenatis]
MTIIETAVIIGLLVKNEIKQELFESSLVELVQLAETAGAEVVHVFQQHRANVDTRTIVGKGKLEEIATYITDNNVDVAIFNNELTPRQKTNIEKSLPCKVVDRTQLILDIFALRAKTHEGKLQVQLAQLQYLLPRLVGKGLELSRLAGGIGTRGPGETKIEVDRRKIRDQISKIKKDLLHIKKQRQIERNLRTKQDIPIIALVGYTNAGKSSLFNLLYKKYHTFPAKEDVFAENKLFATLDTTIRTIEFDNKMPALLIDTVGFIQDLPHNLIAAFRSTLEEVLYADIILIVVDISDQDYLNKLNVVEQVLTDLGITNQNILYVYNKVDLCPMQTMAEWKSTQDGVQISALTEIGIDELISRIKKIIFQEYETVTMYCDFDNQELYSFIHKIGHQVMKEDLENGWRIKFLAKSKDVDLLLKRYNYNQELLERELHDDR